ncbi:hypothetical protein [Labilibaculum euxinus]|uniref:Uncharacterized protein n=1 Tax=Labilibaculum euxinus TaxID=2686357 RepID=A0A7M4DBW3_9BACT|nr:hypothetical protein [Labilibaculum euxinus]MUP40142.1 hypothetical protein [Labilibaculum euxinus]MVB09347.1 hypothetical protein [Labilibaculum euxinus]
MENELLLKQLAEGNKKVFKSIFEDYYRPLCGFFLLVEHIVWDPVLKPGKIIL